MKILGIQQLRLKRPLNLTADERSFYLMADTAEFGDPSAGELSKTFLKALGARARQDLLDIFNLSFSTGKSSASLTTCVAKTLEEILRLYYLAKTRHWLCTEQVGFCKNRSYEAQILRLTQSISDGYQATKPTKTGLALLDYPKAFDHVWSEYLLIRAIDKGLPIAHAQWLRDVLSNRNGKVQINRDRGR